MNRRSSLKTNCVDTDGKLLRKSSRLVQRDLPYHQSRNALNIHLKGLKRNANKLRKHDWFHVWLREHTARSCLLLLITWTSGILFFALLYMGADYGYRDTPCSLVNPSDARSTMNFGGYFAFSLETTTTVGYGLPNGTNAFFEKCPWLQTIMYFQMVWSMMFNAFLFAFFFARLAKSENRGAQVIFSQKVIISRPPPTPHATFNPWTFTVRVTDVDAAYPVVEAHVRLYAKIDSEMVEMRILAPNDVIGSRLLLSWPTTIVHQIDTHSPLHPLTTLSKAHPYELPHRGLNKRHCEAFAADHDRYRCPVCGEIFGTLDRLRLHVTYTSRVERNDKLPQEGPKKTHAKVNADLIAPPPEPTVEELRLWFPEEIVVVVEGIDSLASGTFMALQSYTLDDVIFDGYFPDCIRFSEHHTVVDLDKFHLVMKQPAASGKVTDQPEESDDAVPPLTNERAYSTVTTTPTDSMHAQVDNTANIRQDRHSRRNLKMDP